MAGGVLTRKRRLTRAARRRDERGAVAVLTALLSTGLFVTAALVIDLGTARDTQRESQNASDASALAAANALFPDDHDCDAVLDLNPPCYRDAIDAAKAYAASNYGITDAEWNACNDPDSYWVLPLTTDCVSFTDDSEGTTQPTKPTKVRVTMPMRDVDTIFGASADVDHVTIGTIARATVGESTVWECTICFLGPVDAINGDFTVTGGNIHVNGDLKAGTSPNGVWSANEIGVAGTTTGGAFTPAPVTKPLITDPWASRTDLPPSPLGLPKKMNPCGAAGGPGVYGARSIAGSCTLLPGLYVITGDWSLLGAATLTATSGVTLYFTCGTHDAPQVCGTGQAGARMDAGAGQVFLTAPTTTTPTGGVAGVAMMYDRQSISSFVLRGAGQTHIEGAFYGPSATLEFSGSSCFGFSKGPVIVETVFKANGNKSCLTVTDAQDVQAFETPGEIALDR